MLVVSFTVVDTQARTRTPASEIWHDATMQPHRQDTVEIGTWDGERWQCRVIDRNMRVDNCGVEHLECEVVKMTSLPDNG